MRVQGPSYRFDNAKLGFKPDDSPGSRSMFSDSLWPVHDWPDPDFRRGQKRSADAVSWIQGRAGSLRAVKQNDTIRRDQWASR